MIEFASGLISLIRVPKICDRRGNLSFIENVTHLPFSIGSVGWLYDVPGGASWSEIRPAAAKQAVVALSGSFDVEMATPDGERHTQRLSSPDQVLILESCVKRSIGNFATNSVAMLIDAASCDEAVKAMPVPQIDAHAVSSVDMCRLIDLRRSVPASGFGCESRLTNGVDAPFDIKRVYYLYDLPCDAERGGHSHLDSQIMLVAVSGCFDVVVDDGALRRSFTLNRPYQALLIPVGIWRVLNNFSSGSVCLSLSSSIFAESDYVREYEDFISLTKNKCRIS